MADDVIRGKVAKIINSRELVLNVGEDNGVVEGMIFEILDPKGEKIYDPETEEFLGSLEIAKVRVKVKTVEKKLSIAITYRKKTLNIGGYGPNLSDFSRVLLPSQWIEEYETFKTDEKTIEDIREEESIVKVGDPVKEIRDEHDNSDNN